MRELEAAAVGMDKNSKALPTVLYQCPQAAQERAKTLSDSACRPRPAMQPGHGGTCSVPSSTSLNLARYLKKEGYVRLLLIICIAFGSVTP